jgi:YesN/AraC family two-component response regulator
MIRVLIADDHTVVRQGLKQILSSDPQLAVVAEAANGNEVLLSLEQTKVVMCSFSTLPCPEETVSMC